MEKQINIGIAGTGTVGSKLIKLLLNEHIFSGYEINITGIYARNVLKAKNIVGDKVVIYDDYHKLIENEKIDIIVELIGGDDTAFDIMKKSIENKKTFITANKFLLSKYWKETFSLALKNNVEIGFEAAVAGSIPIIKTLQNQLQNNQITIISGILNGTANYILSKMELEGLDYEMAVKDAQEKGFAESDPSFDVEGIDTAHKIYILSLLAFKKNFSFEHIGIQGIKDISIADISFAKNLGYRIKLLGTAQKIEKKLRIVVEPVLLPLTHSLASVFNEMNAIYYKSDYSGDGLIVGKGAGGLCTAGSVLSDVIYYGIRRKNNFQIQNLLLNQEINLCHYRLNKYYLRFTTVDKAGVIAKISYILAEYNVSIHYIKQKEKLQDKDTVYVVILNSLL